SRRPPVLSPPFFGGRREQTAEPGRRRGRTGERGRGGDRSGPQGPPTGRLRSLFRVRSVAGQVFLLQVLVVTLVIAAALAALLLQARRDSTQDARLRSMDIAKTLACSPATAEALTAPDPTAQLRPRAGRIRKGGGVDRVAVLSPGGVRYTHRDPAGLGECAPNARNLPGDPRTENFHTARGDAGAADVPVTEPDGTVVGTV